MKMFRCIVVIKYTHESLTRIVGPCALVNDGSGRVKNLLIKG